jgi:cytochrome o ubiquinol oxidase subunit III
MTTDAHSLDHHHHHQMEADSTDVFGFWLYIMTDCILFAALFAAFVVLHKPGAYGPSFKSFIELPYVLKETFFLLGSNFTFGLAILAMYKNKDAWLRFFLILTFLLGVGFVFMEVNEFVHLIHQGYSPTVSGSASAFFVLVGTHGFHVSMGLLWILVMTVQVSCFKITPAVKRRLTYLGLFWNFLDIVWIFLFTIVYLLGAVQ